MIYGYSGEPGGNHFSHLTSDSYAFGSTVWVFTNCPVTVHLDGQQMAYTNRSATLTITPGNHNLSFTGDGFNITLSNIQFISTDEFNQALGNLPAGQTFGSLAFTPGELSLREVAVAVGAGLIMWVIVVALLSRIVKVWVAYRFCEEVRA